MLGRSKRYPLKINYMQAPYMKKPQFLRLFKGPLVVALLSLIVCHVQAAQQPDPTDALIYQLKESLVKVNTATKSGGHGFGTAVAISKDHVVTNCHVIANANGISISKWGDEYAPVAIQADWKHDLCILRFEWANLKPVLLGESTALTYEQPVISISMPSDSPAPYVALSTIKALYPLDDSDVIRSEAAFSIGASGSPVFDYTGQLIGISTFKSPGRHAYFYNMSVKWVKALLQTPEIKLNAAHDLPFWDAPDANRPFFMQVAMPFQNNQWQDLQKIALSWTAKEPSNVEAWYYLGMAEQRLGNDAHAHHDFQAALALHRDHPATLQALAVQAYQQGNQAEFDKLRAVLKTMNDTLIEKLDEAVTASGKQEIK